MAVNTQTGGGLTLRIYTIMRRQHPTNRTDLEDYDRSKAATIAAVTLSLVATMMASDVTKAGEAAPLSVALPASIAPLSSVAEPQTDASDKNRAPATFGPAQEVVQKFTAIGSSDLSNSPASARSLGAMVAAYDSAPALDEEGKCLAGAVYFESKGESLAGQLAVARVVINRARSGRFAQSLCGVVYQPGQFSFVRGRSMPTINTGNREWQQAAAIARIAMDNNWNNPAEGALYFHARRVSPGWNRPRVATIDNHIFYR
jgi:spore germination cell wall hydrolase CwlJ-like protein